MCSLWLPQRRTRTIHINTYTPTTGTMFRKAAGLYGATEQTLAQQPTPLGLLQHFSSLTIENKGSVARDHVRTPRPHASPTRY